MQIKRRKTPTVTVGTVRMGGGHPVVIQSMVDTPTEDVSATIAQIKQLVSAGARLVRVTVNTDAAAAAIPAIARGLQRARVDVGIIGDFHYNGHVLLSRYPAAARMLAKYRVNPGNVGRGRNRDKNFETIIRIAKKYGKPIRIGANSGSVDPAVLARMMDKNIRRAAPKKADEVLCDAMVQSVLDSAAAARALGLPADKIVVSVKSTDVGALIFANRTLAKRCAYPIHLGLTEAGADMRGTIASAAGLAPLLLEGIGDTIRISLTPQPGKRRSLEVEACRTLLQSLGLQYFEPTIISCPGCGRAEKDYFQRLAKDIRAHIARRLPRWKKKYRGIERLTIAVMGCVVNGPGESRHADIGISLPGASEKRSAVVFAGGAKVAVLAGGGIARQFLRIVEKHLASHLSPSAASRATCPKIKKGIP